MLLNMFMGFVLLLCLVLAFVWLLDMFTPDKPQKEDPLLRLEDDAMLEQVLAPKSLSPITWDDFYYGLRMVESGGNCDAVGDGGKSKGCYQIQRGYWDAAIYYAKYHNIIRVDDFNWDYGHRVWDRHACQTIMTWYWKRYCRTAYDSRNWEVMARIHNGGPKGHTKPVTLAYWHKVLEQINLKQERDKQ